MEMPIVYQKERVLPNNTKFFQESTCGLNRKRMPIAFSNRSKVVFKWRRMESGAIDSNGNPVPSG